MSKTIARKRPQGARGGAAHPSEQRETQRALRAAIRAEKATQDLCRAIVRQRKRTADLLSSLAATLPLPITVTRGKAK
jgi:hypothetical protein